MWTERLTHERLLGVGASISEDCIRALVISGRMDSDGLVLWQRGNHEMAKQLLAAKVDMDIIDRCGRTARDVAFDEAMIEALVPPPEPEPEEEA